VKYLVNKLDEIEQENKELIESFTNAGEKIRKIVEGILKRL